MKQDVTENLPAYEPVKAALSAPSGAPTRLSDDRRRLILNAARTAAGQTTFADRLARWLDFGVQPVSRYAVLRALVPVAITILMVLGVGGLLMPALSTSRKHAYTEPTLQLRQLALREEKGADRLIAAPSDRPDPSDSSYFFSSSEVAGKVMEETLREEAPAAAPACDVSESSVSSPSVPDGSGTIVIRGLYSNRTAGGRKSALAKYGGGKGAAEGDEDFDGRISDSRSAPAPVAKQKVAAPPAGEALGDRVEEKRLDRDLYSRRKQDAPDNQRLAEQAKVADFKKNQPASRPAAEKKEAAIGGAVSAPSSPSISSTLSADAEAPAKTKSALKPEAPQSSTFRAFGVNPFVEAAQQPFSTFSIDVDSASYTLARNFLNQGKLPPAEAVRTEEIVNYFDYHDTPPGQGLFAVRSEAAPSPFGPGLQLLRIGVKARRLGREENRHAVLTFLVDTSGSMSTPDRLGLIQQSLRLLVDRLAPEDLVALIQFDSHARLTLDYTRAADKARILKAIASIQTSGSTNLEEGMRLAYECARRAFQPGAGNRVLLLSDGAANLGSASAEDILAVVADSRKQGIFCSVYGVGQGGYNDVMLETLANKGDGSYVYLDTLEEARRVFVDDLAATLNTVAADVKIQVEFNPARVKVYRQLGYENRKLRQEDFRNDAIDAGEVGSGQAVTALYELSLVPDAPRGPLGTVRVRYRDLATGRIAEVESPLSENQAQPRPDVSGASFKLAACAAEFAEVLRGSPYAEDGDLAEVAALLRPVALEYALDTRVQELLRLVEKAASLKRDGN